MVWFFIGLAAGSIVTLFAVDRWPKLFKVIDFLKGLVSK